MADNIDGIIERIKKAVRLANKTTEAGERETAMRLAKNLAEKNGIAFDEIAVDEESVCKAQRAQDKDWKATDMVVDGRICQVLRAHFGVVCMMTIRRETDKRKFTYFGPMVNIEIAKYAADILRREACRAWRDVEKSEKEGTLGFNLRRADYMAGFFLKIHKKLEAHPLWNDIREAIQKADAEFKKYEHEQGKVKEHKQRGVKDDAASLYHGYMSADRVSLNRPCGNGAPKAGELQERRQIGRRV